MKQINFLQFAVFMIALVSLTPHSSWAQTTIVLPQACNCPSASDADGDGVPDASDLCPGTPLGTPVDADGCSIQNASTNGTAVVSNYGDATCADPSQGTINGTMTEGVAVSGVTMSLYANVTTLGTYNLSATQNGVTFTGSGTFTALGCQLITLTASGTPTAAGPFTWCTNTTPQGCSPATVDAATPPDSDGDGVPDADDLCPGTPSGTPVDANGCPAPTNPTGTANFSGPTCFDVAEINDGGIFGVLSARQPNKADFATTNTYTYTYTNTVASTDVSFVYINTNGTPIVSISPTTVTASVAANTPLTMTATFESDLNTTAATLSEATAFTADLYVVYTTTAGTFQQKITPNVRDQQCCGAYIAPGEWKQFLCHNLGANTSLDPHDMAQTNAWGLQGAYIQWGKRGPNTTGDSRVDWVTAADNGPQGFAAAPSSFADGADDENAIAGWSSGGVASTAWRTAAGAKTVNDPCPPGWRVPTDAEWEGVENNNAFHRTSSPWGTSGPTQYGNAIHFGPNTSTKTLTLPAAGSRGDNLFIYGGGAINSRGGDGTYWASTTPGGAFSNQPYYLHFVNTGPPGTAYTAQGGAASVRCIAE